MTYVPVSPDLRADGVWGRPITVAILGCGPAGLVAAHAVNTCGVRDFGILSYRRPSTLYGAQYLHAPIPGIYLPDPILINYTLRGSSGVYRQRVYGNNWDGTVSADELEEEHVGWDIRAAYRSLWESYSHYIQSAEVRPHDVEGLLRTVDLLISTIPAPHLCLKGHNFRGRKVWAAGDAPDRGISLDYSCPPNTVILNGEQPGDSPAWYRISNVFGYKTVEWPGDVKRPPIKTVAEVTKPLETYCDCHPGMLRVGRYGAWSKRVLAHHVFEQVREAVLSIKGKVAS